METDKGLRIALSSFAWFSLGLIGIYWCAVAFLPMAVVVMAADGMLASIGFAVVSVFVPGVLQRMEIVDGRVLIRLGIICSWACTGSLCVHRIVVQELGLGGPSLVHPFRGFITVLFMIAAMLHITAIGAIEGHTPRYNVCVVIWSLIGGLAVSAIAYLILHGTLLK